MSWVINTPKILRCSVFLVKMGCGRLFNNRVFLPKVNEMGSSEEVAHMREKLTGYNVLVGVYQ